MTVGITDVSVRCLRDRERPTDNAHQCALILVTAEDGTVGYGEANAHPAAVKALIERDFGLTENWDDGPRGIILGADATNPAGTWQAITASSFWSCRTGLGHVALAGVDCALWDLAGKLAGVPSWQLMGGAPRAVEAYVTIFHGPGRFEETWTRAKDALEWVRAAGYHAAKIEALPENVAEADDIPRFVERAREHVGDAFELLLDVGYRWHSSDEARVTAKAADACKLFALEAPFPPELVAEYRRLQEFMTTPIATGDILTSRIEYLALVECGVVSYVQGGAPRTGMSEMVALATAAAEQDIALIPWGWVATGSAMAANLHVAMRCHQVPLVEYAPPALYPHNRMRASLFSGEMESANGQFLPPDQPGLGPLIDLGALEEFAIEL